MPRRLKTREHGRVQRLIKPPYPGLPVMVHIEGEDAERLYKKIEIENALEGNGKSRLRE